MVGGNDTFARLEIGRMAPWSDVGASRDGVMAWHTGSVSSNGR